MSVSADETNLDSKKFRDSHFYICNRFKSNLFGFSAAF